MKHELAGTLHDLDHLLRRHGEAIAQGDADALPALAEQLQQRLALLARTARGQPLQAGWRPLLTSLFRRAQASQAMLARRQHDVERSLMALSAGLPGLQDLQSRRVYGANGTLGVALRRSRGFERA